MRHVAAVHSAAPVSAPLSTLEVLRRWHAACNDADIDAAVALVHDTVEIRPDAETVFIPSGTRYHGVEGVRSLFAHVALHFPRARTEVHEMRELGAWTLVQVSSTLDVEAPASLRTDRTLLYVVERGLIACARSYRAESDALEAALGAEHSLGTLFGGSELALILVDDAGDVTDVNSAACGLLAASRAEVLGRELGGVLPPAALPLWRQGWDQLRASGQAEGELVLHGGRRARFWIAANLLPGRHLVSLHGGDTVAPVEPRALTDREREVLELLAAGLNAPEIAERLVLSPATVRTHVQNAMGRLGARTRVQAIVLALARGEIAPRP